ncbi:MAG: hypothetical protein KatS3mg023_3515 [Armatimonadota bacterium]|nr:MAG: hypothetical protein KatS3mg023_3515 [Armatimonadota bacterium]
MWVIGILFILAGVEMVLRGERSRLAQPTLQLHQESYERFFGSDVMLDTGFLLSVLLPWLFVGAVFSGRISAPVQGVICLMGSVGSIYVWYKTRHRIRSYQRRFYQALFAGRWTRWWGVGCILLGLLFVLI